MEPFDGRFWWLKDREAVLQFHVVWDAGTHNLADHPTKHHPAQHHKLVRPIHLHEDGKSPTTLAECEAILTSKKPTKQALTAVMAHKSMLAAATAWFCKGVLRGGRTKTVLHATVGQ